MSIRAAWIMTVFTLCCISHVLSSSQKSVRQPVRMKGAHVWTGDLAAFSKIPATRPSARIASTATSDKEKSLPLAIRGRSAYMIVVGAMATEAEKFAASELAQYLRKCTGATLPIVPEANFRGTRAIYLGQTRYAAARGIALTGLAPEQWAIRDAGDSLIIAGGRPRGTLYAVYAFLERFVGVRWLDANTEYTPEKQNLLLPSDISVRGMPAFARREVLMVTPKPKQTLFQVRRRMNSFGNAAVPAAGPELGYSFRFGSPYSTHTHHFYTENFPVDKPEYFALTEKGVRTGPGTEGQVCLSNPEVRRLFAARLREYIRQDREEIQKAGSGEPFPTVYSLVPNDNLNKCVCSGCLHLARKYGAYSGAVLDFINDIAQDIARDHPEIWIATAAYTYYLDLPRDIRPSDNVIVYMAQLGSEFKSLPIRDTLRGMLHPVNRKPRRVLEEWAQISKTLGTHDYWTAWNQTYQWPHANIHGLAQTIKLYHRCGMKHYFVEDELFGARLHNFIDLQFYLASRLLLDPGQNEERIIAEFMEPYYGRAAPAMRRLLDYIEKRQDEQPGSLASVPPWARRTFDGAFFQKTDALLREAERQLAGDSIRMAHVRQERLSLDETMLYLWNSINGSLILPYRREQLLERLQQNYDAAYRKYGGWGETRRKEDEARLAFLRSMPSIPPSFRGKKVLDLCGSDLNLRQAGGNIALLVKDPLATAGTAYVLDASMDGAAGRHDVLPEFGLSDATQQPKFLTRKKMDREEIPKDEQYHFYLAGRMKAAPGMSFYAHHSWGLAQQLTIAYNESVPQQHTYDAYVHLKLEGPAYVPGSVKPNAFSIDRLILVDIGLAK